MNALNLLTELLRQGVRFEDLGGKLRVTTPHGIELGGNLKNEIIANKDDILLRLQRQKVTESDIQQMFPGAKVLAQASPTSDLGTGAPCGKYAWWLSRAGLKVCRRCFPPASSSIVKASIQPPSRN